MLTASWKIKDSIDAVIFDCDGTLSRIEGIDELANHNYVGDIVQRLTAEAMGKSGMNADLYAQRLSLTKPTRSQIEALGQDYFEQRAPHIKELIQVLQRLNKTIYIVSAGFLPAVLEFAYLLGIRKEAVFAVDLQFNSEGDYQDFDRTSPLINKNGKRIIVNEIKAKHGSTAYIGDGLSDLEVSDLVTRFIGYGGAYFRQNIADKCEFYVKSLSLSPLLPLILTDKEQADLTVVEQKIYQEGLDIIKQTVS